MYRIWAFLFLVLGTRVCWVGPLSYGAPVESSQERPVVLSSIYPAEDDGNRLYVAHGTVQHFFFIPANHSDRTFDEFSFVLILPEGIDVIQASGDAIPTYHRPSLKTKEPLRHDGLPMVKWVWKSDRKLTPRQMSTARFFNGWCAAFAPRPTLSLGHHKFYYYIQAGNEREQEHAGELIVIPKPRGRQPKHIVIGMSGWTLSPSIEFWRPLIATYKKCGINLVDCHMLAKGEKWLKPVRDAGMRRWRMLWWFWWNDEYLTAHPDAAAVTFEGKRDEKRVCPDILASEDTDAIAGLMEGIVQQVRAGAIEGTWWDLEGPDVWDVCFCPRCLDAFRRFADIAPDVELAPEKIRADYRSRWAEFACRQSARIAARMKSYAKAAGVDWKLAVYCAIQHQHTREHYRVDWKLLAPHLDAATPSFYSLGPKDLPERFTTGVTWIVNLIKEAKDIPVWAAISTGFGRNTHFITDGRLTKMQIIKSVAFGADGAVQWWWGPTDGRHYAAYAEASSLISELEEFFTEGEMDPQFLSGKPTSGTTRVAWRLGDQVLVMLFNDTDARRIWARTQVPGGYHVARDDGRGRLHLKGMNLRASIQPLDCRWIILER